MIRPLLCFCVLLALGCAGPARTATYRSLGEYVGVVPVDLDALVDSDGDGDPANDIDNEGEIATKLATEAASRAGRGDYVGSLLYLAGAGVAAGGGYLAYRRRRRAKEAPKP